MKKIFLAVIFVSAAAAVFAGGQTAADILKVETGGRALGLAGAFSAASGVEAAAYNPAAIASITQRELTYTHWFSHAQVAVENISYAQRLETALIEGSAGITAVYRHIPAISNEDAQDKPVEYYDLALSAFYSNSLEYFFRGSGLKSFYVGLAGKLIIEQIADFQGSAFAGDIGAVLAPEKSPFRLAAALQNIGPAVRILEQDSPLPLTFRLGGSASFDLDKDNSMTAELDYIQDFYDFGRVSIGLEDKIIDLLFLRAGYSMAFDERAPKYISAGTGISVNTFGIIVNLNYAYRPIIWGNMTSVDHTHALSMLIKI